jgi:signal transduction histidine kinase/DNA-binding response OmpR family regulator
MLLAAIVTAVALVVSGAVLVYYAFDGSARALRHRLETQARIVALSSAAALTFDDAAAAKNMVEALAGDQAILSVAIERADGSRFLEHEFGDASFARVPTLPGVIHVSAEIVLHERIGVVHLWATNAELSVMLARVLAVLAAAVLAALVAALLAASRLQRLISQPILALAGAASAVSKSRDYGVRVPVSSEDEVGRLVLAFNDMLGEMQAQSGELQAYQQELERKVGQRTADLAAALEDAKAAAQAKADFLANMSHEIRTPMNGVIGMLDLMDGDRLDPQRRSMLETARNSAEALLGVINDVLDFSKIDAGKLTLEHIDVELRPLVEEVATLFARQAHGKGVEVACLVEAGAPALVRTDPTRLRQILANLMGNAVKFTERGEVSLTLRTLEASGEHARLQMEVRDTGIGMSAEAMSKLFQSFTQADTSTTRRFGGTGLGLAITKRLVDAMGGEIGVASAPGAGSTFTVVLPLAVTAWAAPTKRSDLSGLHILVVDDNATNRLVLGAHLDEWKVRRQSAASALEGLQLARAAAASGSPLDMILLDYHMPHTDGVEFLRALRADPRIAGVPCLMLSSLGDRPAGVDALGVAAWLNKPVRQSQLYGAIAMVSGLSAGWARAPRPGPVVAAQALQAVPFPGRVLLVEDNLVNQQVAMRLLATFGVTPHIAANGLEGVERVQSEHFDLVFMDCQMPLMDGYQACREIRDWERATRRTRVPIVAMTANAMQGDRERCLEAGMDDYVSKPVKRQTLEAALARWLTPGAAAVPTRSEQSEPPLGLALDRAVLEQLRQLFDGDLSEVIAAYLSDAPAQIDSMESAIASIDYTALGRAAHSLRSSSRSVGAHGVAAAATSIEAQARAHGALEEIRVLVTQLRAAYDAAAPALQAAGEGAGASTNRQALTA